MSVRNAALAAGFLAALLLPISVNAEAALADLYILLPQMLMLGVYLQIKKFFWLIVTLAAVSWGLQGIARYYRENGVHDPLQVETTLLLFHRFINGIGVVALLWLVLTHLLFGEEKLATLHAYSGATPLDESFWRPVARSDGLFAGRTNGRQSRQYIDRDQQLTIANPGIHQAMRLW
jgi:hypothetical protein